MKTWRFGALMAVAIFWCGSAASAAPAIKFEKTVCDFGKITAGQKCTAEFAFKNSGDQPLEVTKIRAICKCTTVAKASMPAVAPGNSEMVEVEFNSSGMQGKVVKRVLVKSNDPTHEKTLLTIQADVQPIAKLTPTTVNFGSIKPNGKYETTITLTPMTPKPFKIVKTEKGQHSRIADFKPIKDGKGSYKLSLVVSAGKVEERVMDELMIVTDLPGQPSIMLTVFGNVDKEPSENASGS
ncbi:MAG: DUF1573 domain-containing protein [Armatimonadota bacterium]|nr:DUF1573 domain-containing protein [bacterium]